MSLTFNWINRFLFFKFIRLPLRNQLHRTRVPELSIAIHWEFLKLWDQPEAPLSLICPWPRYTGNSSYHLLPRKMKPTRSKKKEILLTFRPASLFSLYNMPSNTFKSYLKGERCSLLLPLVPLVPDNSKRLLSTTSATYYLGLGGWAVWVISYTFYFETNILKSYFEGFASLVRIFTKTHVRV